MNLNYLIAFIVYFSFFGLLGFFFRSKNFSSVSFLLGNRSVNHFVAAISAQASDMSDWLFMGYPGLIYSQGLINIWVAIGLIVFMFLTWHFIAPKIRVETQKYDSLTMVSFFENRYSENSGILRISMVFFCAVFFIFYIAAELIGLGRLFESSFGITYNLGVLISIVLVVLNILVGGFVAKAWGDFLRGIFLLFTIIFVPVFGLFKLGGFECIFQSAVLKNVSLSLLPDLSVNGILNIILLSTGWGLGYFGALHVLSNFMSIKDVSKINKAKYLGISWQILVLGAATLVGLVGLCFNNISNKEMVFVEMVKSLFNPIFGGFMLCAILSATMSVMTSQVFTLAGIISEDVIKKILKRTNQKAYLLATRISIIVIPLVSSFISYNSTSSINSLVSFAWSGLGICFGPLVILSLYSKSVNKYGAIAGVLFGGLFAFTFYYINISYNPLLYGFLISLGLIYLISYLTKNLV